MKAIPPDIKTLYDKALIKRAVPVPVHLHYREWLRYYLDFNPNTIMHPIAGKVWRRLSRN